VITAAGIMFVDPTGAVLLLRRTEAGDAEGAWAFPGGKLEEGETTAEAARRECVEELGSCPEGELSEWTHRIRDSVDYTTFIQRVPERFSPTLNEEHDAFEWANVEELLGKPGELTEDC